MDLSALTAVSPIDGRYGSKTADLREVFSEFGLIKRRILVEIRWLQCLAAHDDIAEVPALSVAANSQLENILLNFSASDAQRIKDIERTTNHDVKAVEYFIKERFAGNAELESVAEFVHFACTSEDINNLSYSLMLKQGRDAVLLPALGRLQDALLSLSHTQAAQAHDRVSLVGRQPIAAGARAALQGAQHQA